MKPKKVSIGKKIEERERKEREELEASAVKNLADEDESAKRERLKKAELDADLDNAADLLGDIDIHPRAKKTAAVAAAAAAPAPTVQKLSDFQLFHPKTGPEFDKLRKTLVPILTDLSKVSTLHYSNFTTDLCRDTCKVLTTDQIRKVISTLNAVVSDKVKQERLNRGKKPKVQVRGASAKIDDAKDITNYDDFDDDLDFM